MKPSDRWDLSHLLKNPADDFDPLVKELDSKVSQFESFRDRLNPQMTSQAFLEVMRLSEEIAALSAKLGAYAYLWFSEDTKNSQARAFKNKVEERLTSLQNRVLFFDLWWQKVDEESATRLLEASGDFRYHLETIRRFKDHTLSEPEEKIINIKNVTGRDAINTLYDVLTNGFTFTLTVNGVRKSLTREQLSSYLRSSKPRVREQAYQELFRVFAGHHDLIGEIYTTLVNEWKGENLELRRFSTPIMARNLGNDVPDEAVDALLSVCFKNAEIFQEYFRIKGRLCRIKPMNRYHLYAPHRTERKRYLPGCGAHGPRRLPGVFTSPGGAGPAGLRRTPSGRADPAGQAERSLLLQRGPGIHSLCPAELHRRGAGCRHLGARAGPCGARDDGLGSFRLYLPCHAAAGRDRLGLR